LLLLFVYIWIIVCFKFDFDFIVVFKFVIHIFIFTLILVLLCILILILVFFLVDFFCFVLCQSSNLVLIVVLIVILIVVLIIVMIIHSCNPCQVIKWLIRLTGNLETNWHAFVGDDGIDLVKDGLCDQQWSDVFLCNYLIGW
jgi:hypothetical protein